MMTHRRCSMLLVIFLAAAIVLAPAGSEGAPAAGSLQALYEAAKVEGEVAFWSPTAAPDEFSALTAAFSKRFPGIKVNPFEITAGQMVQRFVTEAQIGKVSGDTGEGSIGTLIPLLERNLIQGYDDWGRLFQGAGVKINPNSIVLDGRGLIWYTLSHPIVYNTKLLRREEAPKTWEDLLDPKWKGNKILLEGRAKAFGYLGLKWGEEKMVDYVRKIMAQKPIFAKGGTAVIQQLASGEAPLGLGTYGYKVMQFARDKKAPVDLIDTTNPIAVSQHVTFALKGAKHPNAAKLLIGWLSSSEALKIMENASFNGQLIPGSDMAEYKRYMKNNVEIIYDSPDTAKKSAELEKKSSEILGAIR
jgi:iron(III) transport system substrate-binding protein